MIQASHTYNFRNPQLEAHKKSYSSSTQKWLLPFLFGSLLLHDMRELLSTLTFFSFFCFSFNFLNPLTQEMRTHHQPRAHQATCPHPNTPMHAHTSLKQLPRGATTTRHVSRAPETKNSKIQPRVPLNLKCYKILSIFLIEFPNSLKSQNCPNYQNTLFLLKTENYPISYD